MNVVIGILGLLFLLTVMIYKFRQMNIDEKKRQDKYIKNQFDSKTKMIEKRINIINHTYNPEVINTSVRIISDNVNGLLRIPYILKVLQKNMMENFK